MRIPLLITISVVALVSASAVQAQQRRIAPAPAGQGELPDIPRDPSHPGAGVWRGARTHDGNIDSLSLELRGRGDHLAGAFVFGDGGRIPMERLSEKSDGLRWEMTNSGGGRWVYEMRFDGPDAMRGTFALTDAPANLADAPSGTLMLARRVAPKVQSR